MQLCVCNLMMMLAFFCCFITSFFFFLWQMAENVKYWCMNVTNRLDDGCRQETKNCAVERRGTPALARAVADDFQGCWRRRCNALCNVLTDCYHEQYSRWPGFASLIQSITKWLSYVWPSLAHTGAQMAGTTQSSSGQIPSNHTSTSDGQKPWFDSFSRTLGMYVHESS
jgi:hypothetical protein